ncbi:ankyrin repeat-containing domain, PGG domain protein [Artemisia annua]|uniref:Ankyrin repeat-containing domain, PGG domain protein n=1 Tax=Artemisia annua TaxID=35608 RepID=A0A2U1P835_ARTAN|nr:ankyrin repeat-containing domain, PGG domain protein [Artemisia annua]
MYIDEIDVMMKGPPRIFFVAAERGNTRFLAECLRTYPDLMFDKNERAQYISYCCSAPSSRHLQLIVVEKMMPPAYLADVKNKNGQTAYLVFVIAHGISLILSVISRYGPRDFMYSLPDKLMIGLLGLVFSVAAMTVAFTTSFFMLYRKGLSWLPILCATFAFLPAIVFVALEYPLLIDMYLSKYDSRYLFNSKKHMLYNIKPKFQSLYHTGLV